MLSAATKVALVMAVLSAGVAPSMRRAGHGDLSTDKMNMLQDPGGWEYLTITDPDNGIQTTHTCFDGHPHPGSCSGTLTFTSGGTFVQNVHVHGGSAQRHGTFQLDDDNNLSFYDELGTRDGPYTLELDTTKKSLTLTMPSVRIELELEKQYKEDLKARRKPNSGKSS